MNRLARIGGALLGRRLRETVSRHDARGEGVVIPALRVPVENANVAKPEYLNVGDAVRGPARHRAGRRGLILLPREPDVGRRDRNAVLPFRVAQPERRDEAPVGRVRVVAHDAKASVLERRDRFGQTRDQLIVRIASDKRLGDGRGDEARGGVVVEDAMGLPDETDDNVASCGGSGRACADDADDDHEREREGATPGQLSAAKPPVRVRTRWGRNRNDRPSEGAWGPKQSRKHRP